MTVIDDTREVVLELCTSLYLATGEALDAPYKATLADWGEV